MALPSFRNLILGVGVITVDDCDNKKSAGVFYITSSTQHHPTGTGNMLLCVYTWGNGFVKQEATRATNAETYYRTYDSNAGTWTTWYKYTVTVVS